MDQKSEYKLDDWIIHRATGDIYEITRVYPDLYNPKYECVKIICGMSKSKYLSHYKSLKDYDNLKEFFALANSAQVLYNNKLTR